MTEEIKIGFETAKLAKEKGLREIVFYVDGVGGNLTKQVWNPPTQSQLQTWLRDIHNIIIESNYDPTFEKFRNLCLPMNIQPKTSANIYRHLKEGFSPSIYDSYEQALEEGLIQGLNLIKL